MGETIEAKLAGLGIPKEEIPFDIEILTASPDIGTLNVEKRTRNWGAASEDQYLTRIFKPLYEQDATVRERVHRELGSLGVPSDIVYAFFTEYLQAGILFRLLHQDIPVETADKFIYEANQLSLMLLRDYLGINEIGATNQNPTS